MKKLKQLFFILTFLICGIALHAQTWDLIGNGIGQDVSYRNDVDVYNNELYVSEIIWNGSTPGTEVKVRKWDGQSWVTLPSYTTPTFTEFGDMTIFQGEIYIGLVMASGTTSWLVKFDGMQWSAVPMFSGVLSGSVRSLEVHNGELYIGGFFDVTIGGTSYENILKYDGTSFTGFTGLSGPNQTVSDIYFANGDVYVLARQLYKLNGTTFGTGVQIHQSGTSQRSFLASYNNELYCATDTFLYKVGASASTLIKTFPYRITDMDVYNGELYVVGDTLRKTWTLGGGLTKYDGQTFTILSAPNALHSGEVYNGALHYFSCSVTMFNGQQYDRAFKMSNVLGLGEKAVNQSGLSVYPNPAHGLFYIENSLNEEQEVKLIDATGKVIKSISLQPEMKAEIGTESLAPGMYFINNGSNTHRVIITP
ncbi:T9SS type A sorting domain-containing protein [Owenweeksia hongkongensis]|uniref:T9SS type A sorting domain-containing protein n=1 Tax=Owenweeksia hongkongensis TaxID=253245 RepID=UPI003A8E5FD8